jgi:hypothetical protein
MKLALFFQIAHECHCEGAQRLWQSQSFGTKNDVPSEIGFVFS